uniref:Uncharacterized protein n=1 Tax=Rhodnius prolixus TaxID=13249 RepID=T1IFH3_RHOPR
MPTNLVVEYARSKIEVLGSYSTFFRTSLAETRNNILKAEDQLIMSAAILIVITLSQLMLTPSASILTEIINDVTLFKNELNTFMAKDGNTTARSASGEFVRPPKVVDTTIIKTKLHELQNNVTKLAEAISNKNQNEDDIKNTIFSLEKQIEDLIKQNDDKDREIAQTLEIFENIISDLLAKYNNREQYEEFLEAIKHKYYQLAADKFATMKNETRAIKFVGRSYEQLDDLPSMLEFADKVDDLKRQLLIYKTIIKSNTFGNCYDYGNTTANSASGEFVRPPKVVDTTIIKNKLHELQNNVTKLAEAISNKNQNVDDIKNTISSMEKQIEDLIKQNDKKDREITQTLAQFQNILSDLLAKYINLQQEFAKLQYEEFLGAIKHKFYKFAAVKFVSMKNETSAENLVERVYEEIGDLPPMLEFADHVDDLERKFIIYRAIINSKSFLHCLRCNVLLTSKKLVVIRNSNKITGEQKEIVSNTIDQFNMTNTFKDWMSYPLEDNIQIVNFLVYKYCLAGRQLVFSAKPGIQDYFGYCYPIHSIYNILTS